MVDIKSVISEAVSTHMNAVHYSPHKGSHKQFKIHKVGSNFQKHVKPGDVVPSSAIDDLADAGAKLKQIKEETSEEELDESTHMAVHVYPTTKAHTSFKVHKVGAGVKHVKVGDTVSSSDLDDLSDAGHKVKEVKAPK